MQQDQEHHCPFLNRADARCSMHFSLERLGHAFAYCFGRYHDCPAYVELLVERRVKRMTACGGGRGDCDGSSPIVQITLGARLGAGRRSGAIASAATSAADQHHQQAA